MANDEYGTPDKIYNLLDDIFHFTLDPAASDINHKCDKYYTKETNGLEQSWEGEVVFLNPPYSRGQIDKWLQKTLYEWQNRNVTIVCLLPVDTSTKWFHRYVYPYWLETLKKYSGLDLMSNEKGVVVWFIKGRLRFIEEDGKPSKGPAKFGSMVVVYNGEQSNASL